MWEDLFGDERLHLVDVQNRADSGYGERDGFLAVGRCWSADDRGGRNVRMCGEHTFELTRFDAVSS